MQNVENGVSHIKLQSLPMNLSNHKSITFVQRMVYPVIVIALGKTHQLRDQARALAGLGHDGPTQEIQDVTNIDY